MAGYHSVKPAYNEEEAIKQLLQEGGDLTPEKAMKKVLNPDKSAYLQALKKLRDPTGQLDNIENPLNPAEMKPTTIPEDAVNQDLSKNFESLRNIIKRTQNK